MSSVEKAESEDLGEGPSINLAEVAEVVKKLPSDNVPGWMRVTLRCSTLCRG